ncbi:hypothetical protein K432DRAFT_394990 [Lepidopterella palustris CBS 459.81]|uniref:Uncharacterized protein n=1 Tax=Lepidopterella palustris CBS 459.81 TaxID=1314670 RepID=A0A8E2E6D4_9PEZI|nr:hypothetical protein K432DRAFT_394990 [Lepidopterella palustris CBS 459.81]
MACVFSSLRIGEYIESTCRLETCRGLYYKGNTKEIETAALFGRYLRELGFCIGYITPLTVYNFRAKGLFLIDKHYLLSARIKHGGHKDKNIFRNYYKPNNAGTNS